MTIDATNLSFRTGYSLRKDKSRMLRTAPLIVPMNQGLVLPEFTIKDVKDKHYGE
jgi:hypothetical protein